MNWQIKQFTELSHTELWQIYKNRVDVFVVEQNCPYPEVDEYDLTALHLFVESKHGLAAYCRMIPTAHSVKIGRVLVAKQARGEGLARKLMAFALQEAKKRFPRAAVCIQAQLYLQDFYQSLGFTAISTDYLEDGIPHIDMTLKAI